MYAMSLNDIGTEPTWANQWKSDTRLNDRGIEAHECILEEIAFVPVVRSVRGSYCSDTTLWEEHLILYNFCYRWTRMWPKIYGTKRIRHLWRHFCYSKIWQEPTCHLQVSKPSITHILRQVGFLHPSERNKDFRSTYYSTFKSQRWLAGCSNRPNSYA